MNVARAGDRRAPPRENARSDRSAFVREAASATGWIRLDTAGGVFTGKVPPRQRGLAQRTRRDLAAVRGRRWRELGRDGLLCQPRTGVASSRDARAWPH